MKVALSTIGKFHTFDLARELYARHALQAIFTGYPRFKLHGEGLPREMIHTFPWIRTPFLAFPYKQQLGGTLTRLWEYMDKICFDTYVHARLPPCDVFVGLSGSALRSGRLAQTRGAKYVCDRGSSHIRVQDSLLREEHECWGAPYEGINPRVIELEEREYGQADLITVPSHFAVRTFLDSGIAAGKIARLPYGVNLSKFAPEGRADPSRFDVLFVGGLSLRKGIPYLIQAYRKLVHSRKSLTLVGSASTVFIEHLKKAGVWDSNVLVLGHVPQGELKHIMSQSHVMVLPSIEEGFGMVLAQAMACGCPIIGTINTGTPDLLSEEGREGFVVPIRNGDAIAQRLQQLADDGALQLSMRDAALARTKAIGGWRDYGSHAIELYKTLQRSL